MLVKVNDIFINSTNVSHLVAGEEQRQVEGRIETVPYVEIVMKGSTPSSPDGVKVYNIEIADVAKIINEVLMDVYDRMGGTKPLDI